jgi:hypothetical protein
MTDHHNEPEAIDRTGWPSGPWDGEPDRVEWRHQGLPCLAVRGPLGAWCGYVGVPPGHPWHGQGYDAVDAEAHGGLTYAAACARHVCHVPAPGEPADVWWVGFDCGHAEDRIPGMEAAYAAMGLRLRPSPWPGVEVAYRDLTYVRAEVEDLARQALEAQRPPPGDR